MEGEGSVELWPARASRIFCTELACTWWEDAVVEFGMQNILRDAAITSCKSVRGGSPEFDRWIAQQKSRAQNLC
ncbi:MAG: hypothetical protein AAGE59_00760 [Cyanobacteria bacterium P01_F01_bin.86]